MKTIEQIKKDFEIREPFVQDEENVLKCRQEFIQDNSYINGGAGLTKISDYAEWLQRVENDKNGSNRPKRTELLFIRKSDDRVVGFINIRHTLENGFDISGGHIGYSIRPSERNKGYGTILLSIAIDYCRKKLNMKKVLVTCDKSNIASKKVIINNNGKFENEVAEGENIIERYWIKN